MTSSDQSGANNGYNSAVANANSQSGSGLFIENTIIIQYDPQVQEIWDQARRLRCTWYVAVAASAASFVCFETLHLLARYTLAYLRTNYIVFTKF